VALTQSWEKQVLLGVQRLQRLVTLSVKHFGADPRPNGHRFASRATTCRRPSLGLLEFICGDLGEPTTSEADVIQRIFYDDGWVWRSVRDAL
jgi:hypothetical protein